MSTDNLVKRLPDCYRKDNDSNNYKLLQVAHRSVQNLEDDNKQLLDVLDIMKASGKTLDLYGETYKQKRGALTDEQYRIVILQKVAQCFVNCDYDSTVKALARVFSVDVNSFVIENTDVPLTVNVKNLPYDALRVAGITGIMMRQIIKSMMTVGVALGSLELDGTFEFSSRADEYDELKGFSNLDQSLGGYLGALAENGTTIPM